MRRRDASVRGMVSRYWRKIHDAGGNGWPWYSMTKKQRNTRRGKKMKSWLTKAGKMIQWLERKGIKDW